VSFRRAALGPTKGQAQTSGTKEKGLTFIQKINDEGLSCFLLEL